MSRPSRLSIGEILQSASQRLRARINGEPAEVVQLKAELLRHATEAAGAKSREELLAALAKVLEKTFEVAATAGTSRSELEARVRPDTWSRSMLGHVSQLRSSVARAALDGSVHVTTHLRRVAFAQTHSVRERAASSPQPAAAGATARAATLQESVTIVRQRFLGSRGSSLTRVRSFTRVIPAARDWTLEAIDFPWLLVPSHARANETVAPALARESERTATPPAKPIPSVVLRSSLPLLRRPHWVRLGERRPSAPATRVAPVSSGLTFPTRVRIATRKEVAAWAVAATSRLIVERLLVPYLRRLAAQHASANKGKLLWELGGIAVPLGLRLLANNPLRNP